MGDETTTIGTSTSTTTTESPKNIKSTTAASGTTPTKVDKLVPTATNVRVHDRISTFSSIDKPIANTKNQYLALLQKIKAGTQTSCVNGKCGISPSPESEYDIVNDDEYLPVRSNLYSEGPLRPKPPTEQIVQVSPAPFDTNQKYPPITYGVSNPNWFSQQKTPTSTEGYGPDDFLVETVNLDKDFFYQFFTSKPMIIDTDVVTSTSVQVNKDSVKRGRDASNAPSLSALPDHLQGNQLLPE